MHGERHFDGGPLVKYPDQLTPERVVDVAVLVGPTAMSGATSPQIADPEHASRALTLDFPGVSSSDVGRLLAERVPATTIRPQLVLPQNVRAPEVYARLSDHERKDEYRGDLRRGLLSVWEQARGNEKAAEILHNFDVLTSIIEEDGAVVMGDLLDRDSFSSLVESYDKVMDKDGSQSLLHSYANLRNQPKFLADPRFNRAFFHPLAVALISERVGGAVRVVDARAKDAGPISVRAQDNMLHIDNTPFRDEYKVLVTWEKGRASGPKGQNFVFLPGTHKGVRDCLIGTDGRPFSTENASIFIHPEDVEQVFGLQRLVRPEGNAVVEIHDRNRPTTTVFPSGSLVHHRLRTEGGSPRSGLIIAFHRTGDTPGEFIANDGLSDNQALERALFGFQDAGSDAAFRRVLTNHAAEIAEKVEEIFSEHGTVIIDSKAKTLSAKEMEDWYKIATDAPTVETIKQRDGYFPLGGELSFDEFIDLLGSKMMKHDKHGPIDMILYADGHEEPRKWARNRIREMHEDALRDRLAEWCDEVRQPVVTDLLTIDEMSRVTAQLAESAASVLPEDREQGHLDPIERISPSEAYRSVAQLIIDLGENLTRADDRQTYLSGSLFQFWACDELNRLRGNNDPQLRELGGKLLRNYIATAVLVEKQIAYEKSNA